MKMQKVSINLDALNRLIENVNSNDDIRKASITEILAPVQVLVDGFPAQITGLIYKNRIKHAHPELYTSFELMIQREVKRTDGDVDYFKELRDAMGEWSEETNMDYWRSSYAKGDSENTYEGEILQIFQLQLDTDPVDLFRKVIGGLGVRIKIIK